MTKSLVQAEEEAMKIVAAATAAAAGVGWVPGSSLLLAGVDTILIKKVADAFGVKSYSVEQVAATAGKRYVGKAIATELLSLFPGPGWAIKSGVSSTMTAAAGALLIQYMKAKSPYI
jgi:hypothetical protein